MSKHLILDVETTTKNKGNPFTHDNQLCYTGWKLAGEGQATTLSHLQQGLCVNTIQAAVDSATHLVAFNAKFDCHWLERIGVSLRNVRIWDCQYAEFLFNQQRTKYPSLEEAAVKYGIPGKLDVVKTEYWDRRCACHVSVVERMLQFIAGIYASDATIDRVIKKIENKEQLLNGLGDIKIQKLIELLLNGELRSYVLTLQQRLLNIEQDQRDSINYPMQSTIDSWLLQNAKFVEKLKSCALTTTTLPERLEVACVEHVMLLWDMLRNINGWNRHSDICNHLPVDTIDIPPEIVVEYLLQDLNITEQLFHIQQELFRTTEASKWRLFQLHMEDQVVLREMERNGILYKTEESLKLADDAQLQIARIEEELRKDIGGVPINWNSGDHLSAYLYGGTIDVDTRVPVGVFKTGANVGQTRYKIVTHSYQLERQFQPIKGSELVKDGYYSTDEATLRQLKGAKSAKERLGWLDKRAKLEKLRGTYYAGYAKKIDEMGWLDNTLHPTLNQCVAVTGRLSSSNPNGQNQPEESKRLCVSRYDSREC